VHAHHRRFTRAVLVTGLTAFAITLAPRAIAQDLPGVPWWRQMPAIDGALQTSLIESVQRTPAAALDPALPPMPFDEWLFVTLAPVVEHLPPRLLDWSVTFCLDRRSAIPGPAPELCVEGSVALAADRRLRLEIAVAEAVRPRSTGRPYWRPTVPSLRDVYIERLNGLTPIDSLDVPSLSQGTLLRLRLLPFDEWPAAAFESTITWDPPHPSPGETVRFSISVRNTGRRSVDRVWISILISPCCPGTEARHEWFPRIAAGQSVRVEAEVPLSEGQALAMVSVRAWQGAKRVRESNGETRPTVASIGYPPSPR
jgi:hypothetical protein